MGSAVQPIPADHPVHYERHRPEHTLLYQLVEEYYPAFKADLEAQGTALPHYVEQEFEDYLKCGRLEHGFLRVRWDACHAEHLVAAVRSAAFARAAERGAWPKAPHCWSMKSFPSSR